MQFIDNIKLLHVSTPTCHPQGVIENEYKPKTLVQVLNCPCKRIYSSKILNCIKT